MERLVKDASKMKEGIAAGVKAGDMSFGNIVKAIHAVQENMSITGTTAKEASSTITGSVSSMKAAWGNLLPALVQGGDQFDQCVKNLKESIVGVKDETGKLQGGVLNNLMPAVLGALDGLGALIEDMTPIIAEQFPILAEKLIPPLIKSAVRLTQGLINALPTLVKALAVSIVDIFGEQFPIIAKIGNFFKDNANSIGGALKALVPIVISLAAAFKGFKAVKSITSIFGGSKSGGGEKGGGSGLFGGLTNTFKSLAQTKTSVILKGMANLGIIIGGMALLTAGVMAVAPHMAKLTDFKSIVEVISVMTVLGAVGTALAKFASIVGKISIVTVLKGLANMSLVLVGVGALLWATTKVFANGVNFKEMLQVVTLVGILGTVGSVLSVFAGIVGLIPIPVVLAGLANIALVLGGMTALIVAFGKLTEIKGFTSFIEAGGVILPKICNIIGDMAGSLVGGLAEGVTDSLPKIGENIAAFATSLKPMFTMFSGADMGSIGSFFKSLGSFMLQMAGEGILSFFTGGTDFAELGTQLNTFAEKSQGFFTKVAEFPANGFTNATKLFDCLAGLKSLPKEGGVMGWFNGELNYSKIAVGLSDLSNEQVIGFFNKISTVKQAGFDNATKLFDCLAGLKSLPKEGGVVGWFSGNVNYANIAAGLGHLSGEKVSGFFTMVGALKSQAFENTKLFFECLAGIGDLPKEGGWWDKLTGTETTALDNIAKSLGTFNDNAKPFFEAINELKIDNLNGLWDSLAKAETLTADLSTKINDNIDDIVKKISELPKKMGDALKGGGKSLSTALVDVWKDAVKASVAPVNKVLSAANWILKEFGSKKRVIEWTPYARGTGGHKGGNALVNDGRGAELVQMPNGHTFIPQGRNVFMPNAPKGMKVLPAESTARLFGKSSPTFKYADGIGNIDIWSYYDNPKGLVDATTKGISYKGMSSFAAGLGAGMVSTFKGEMSAWVKKLFDEEGGKSLASYVASKGVEQWKSTVVRALKMEGQYSAANVKRTLFQMQTESGGNPRAINLWDSNAKKGIPSKGLMQVIDPTFRAYARAGFNKNIYDPLSNILASVRYATSRYGSLGKAYRGVGYSKGVGTVSLPQSPLNVSYTPENSFSGGRATVTEHNTYAPVFNLTIEGGGDERAMERKVKRWVKESMDEVFSSMTRKNPRLQEV